MKNIDPAAYPALRTVWIFTGVTSLFVPLRIYIRVKILEGFRKDDFCYVVSFACLFLYAILITNSAEHGLGQDISTITAHPPEEHVKAVLDVIIGQTFLIIGNVASKLSITFFLNHMARQLINNRIHMIALWTPVTLFTIFITAALFISWFPCQPAARLWDPRVDGHCSSDLLPVAYVAGALSAIVDICYAIYPWCLLWKSYRHPQKLVVLLSLSLGVAAAGIGVKRAFELWRLASHNYLKDTPELVIWHTAELAVTLIAIGIPICFPLYKRSLEKLASRSSWLSRVSGIQRRRTCEVEEGVYTMHTIGGTHIRIGEDEVKTDQRRYGH